MKVYFNKPMTTRYPGGSGFELDKSDQACRKHYQGGIQENRSLNFLSQIMHVGRIFTEVSRSFGV